MAVDQFNVDTDALLPIVNDIVHAQGFTNAANNGGSGLQDPNFKRNLDIVQLDRDGSEVRRYRLQGAWPNKFVAGEWDNEAEENVIEMLTLVFDFFDEA